MNGKTLIRMMILVVFEYVITTTIAWRWVLGADFPWWKPFTVVEQLYLKTEKT